MSIICSVPVSTSSAVRRSPSISRSGALALSIRVAGAGGLLLSHVVLARSLGVAGFGDYAQAIAWLQVFAVLGKLGLDNTSLRYVSEYVTLGDMSRLRGLETVAFRASAIVSLPLALVSAAAVWIFWDRIGSGLAGCLIVAATMIPLLSLRQIQEANLRSRGHFLESQISMVIWPLMLFAMAAMAWRWAPEFAASSATLLHFIAFASVSLLVYYFLTQARRQNAVHTPDTTHYRAWAATAGAFVAAELLIAMKSRACVGLAGIQLGRDSAGLYAAMERFADVSLLVSQSLGLVMAPQFAALFAAGRHTEMRRLMWQGQLLGLGSTIPVAIGVVCFGDWIFWLIGQEYRQGWSVLLMLLGSACVAAFAGPGAYVLQMTGHERTMLWITAACAACNLAISPLLMMRYGVLGLGASQVITSLVWSVAVQWHLQRHPVWQKQPTDHSSQPLAAEVAP